MSEATTYTVKEAHLHFARQINGKVWELLGMSGRSPEQDMEMVHAAHASLHHWLQIGNAAHHQRGEWLIARVYIVLENPYAALRHARRCLKLTTQNPEEMEDFDVAYAHEALARASALSGDTDAARDYRTQARRAGDAIEVEEDRRLFLADFEGGDWYGVG